MSDFLDRLRDEADLLSERIATWDQDESLLPEQPALRALVQEAAKIRKERLRIICQILP